MIDNILNADHTLSRDRYESDWIFTIEVIEGIDILYAYIIYIDSRSRNVFYEEYVTHTWVSFYRENFSRPVVHFMEYFQVILESMSE